MHRVAVVGSGNMARVHGRHWLNMAGAEIVGFVSHDTERANELATRLGTKAYGSLDDVLVHESPDIVDICTPTPTHKPLALQCLASGKHTFLEKPMALNVADCDELIRARDKAGVAMMIGHVLRFFPEYEQAHRVVASGALGTVATIRAARLAGHPKGGWQDWYSDHAQSGGAVLDLLIHDLDWMRWCLGEVDRVFAKGLTGNPAYTGSLDYALVTLHFKNGAIGHACGSWAHPGGFRTQFEVCGDAGMIEHDSQLSSPLTIATRQTEGGAPGVAVPESPVFDTDDPYYRELAHFVDCIDTGREPSVTLADARSAVEIAVAAIASIQSGRAVEISD